MKKNLCARSVQYRNEERQATRRTGDNQEQL